ncbi:MAG: M23 family metallopeptidase, partial [Bryobacteraceae bacterium]|nr:M23 family metallopeptidase [Bryobacteraceae bacterium]
DYRCGSRTYQAHSGLDIRLPDMAAQKAGVDVLAAADGKVLRVRDGVADISVRDVSAGAIKDQECGNGLVLEHTGGLSTQYCHMAKGSLKVRPGDVVKTGTILGRVGLSGNTEYPHLHMTVRRDNVVIDPFAPEAGARPNQCGAGEGLWRPDARAALTYNDRVVLNAGFTTGAITMAQLEAGGLTRASSAAPALVVYVRSLGLQAQDVQSLTLLDPAGRVLAASANDPLPRDQAQRLLFIGKPRPASGWANGRYRATYTVKHGGQVVLERSVEVTL